MSVPSPKEINLLYNMPVTNFNEARLINYYAFKRTIATCSDFDLLPDMEKCVYYKHSNIYPSSDEWSRLSVNVISKLSLNFPIVYDVKMDRDGNLVIYYEKIKFNKIINDKKLERRLDFVDEIVFQKVLIGYTLYNLGYSSYTYYFDIYDIPPTTIAFKIKDLFFVFNIKKLVILGSKTQIITKQTLESVHLNKILQNIENAKQNGMYIKFFLENFIKYLDKKMIPNIPNQLIFETRLIDIENIQRGTFVKFINNNTYNYGILVDYFLGEQCEIWHFSENKNKRDIIVILKNLPDRVYEKENLNFISQYYTIGDSLINCH